MWSATTTGPDTLRMYLWRPDRGQHGQQPAPSGCLRRPGAPGRRPLALGDTAVQAPGIVPRSPAHPYSDSFSCSLILPGAGAGAKAQAAREAEGDLGKGCVLQSCVPLPGDVFGQRQMWAGPARGAGCPARGARGSGGGARIGASMLLRGVPFPASLPRQAAAHRPLRQCCKRVFAVAPQGRWAREGHQQRPLQSTVPGLRGDRQRMVPRVCQQASHQRHGKHLLLHYFNPQQNLSPLLNERDTRPFPVCRGGPGRRGLYCLGHTPHPRQRALRRRPVPAAGAYVNIFARSGPARPLVSEGEGGLLDEWESAQGACVGAGLSACQRRSRGHADRGAVHRWARSCAPRARPLTHPDGPHFTRRASLRLACNAGRVHRPGRRV